MPVKDKVVTWFIQNVISPKREIIDKPGFVVTTFTEENVVTYLREFFLPEILLELIEKNIVNKYGKDGEKVLYSAGKKFGYLYSSMSNFPTVDTISQKELSEFAYLLVRYIEGTYAKQAKHDIDFENKIFNISFQEYIVCRHNGLGLIMSEGGISGIWSYIMQDKSIEGIQLKCQGRGDEKCNVICGPKDKLVEMYKDMYIEQDLIEYKFDEYYKTMNEIRQTNYCINSLKDLLDNSFFDHKKGILSYKDIRVSHIESHLLYILENEIEKLEGGEKLLFETCFEFGQILRRTYGENDYESFLMDFFPALGFGDIAILNPNGSEIASIYYPWSIFSEKSKYTIFRGIISGFVSDSLGTRVEYNNFDIDISTYLTLTIKSN